MGTATWRCRESVMGIDRQEDTVRQPDLAQKVLDREGVPYLNAPSAVRGLGLQAPQELSPLSPICPEPSQPCLVEMHPQLQAGLHLCCQHHAILPMEGVGLAGALSVCGSLCTHRHVSSNLHMRRLSNLPPGRAQSPLHVANAPGLGARGRSLGGTLQGQRELSHKVKHGDKERHQIPDGGTAQPTWQHRKPVQNLSSGTTTAGTHTKDGDSL